MNLHLLSYSLTIHLYALHLLCPPDTCLCQPPVLPNLLLYGADKLGPLDGAEQNHLVRIVDQGKPSQLPALSEDLPQLLVSHPVPDEPNVPHHEILNEDIVCSTGGGDDVWEVRELFNEDDAVIATWLETGSDSIGDKDCNEDGNTMRDLPSHFEHDNRDGDGVSDCT